MTQDSLNIQHLKVGYDYSFLVYYPLFRNKSNVYNLLAERRSAIDDYSQAIQLNSQHSEAHYNRGIAHSLENEPEKALEDLQRAATLFQAQGDTANYQRALDRIREIQGM